MNWLYSILVGTCFFIGGQLFLRKTFEENVSKSILTEYLGHEIIFIILLKFY